MDDVTTNQRVVFVLCSLLVTLPSMAVAGNSTTVTVKVTVMAPPPCIVNDDKPITVEFNEVLTTRVDGNNYKMPLDYTLSCMGGSFNAMKLQVQGSGAEFDTSVLQTSQTGLGIKLLQENGQLPLNGWLNFNYPGKPALWAVPVKGSDVMLSGGEFTAAATMKVVYQ